MADDNEYRQVLSEIRELKREISQQGSDTQHIREMLEASDQNIKDALNHIYYEMTKRVANVEKGHTALTERFNKQSGMIRGVAIAVGAVVGLAGATFATIYNSFDGRLKAIVKYVHFLDDKRITHQGQRDRVGENDVDE